MMIIGIRSSDRPLDQDEIDFRRQALRDAVLCIGWLKLSSVVCYIVMCVLVYMTSTGRMSMALQIMLIIMIPLEVLHGLVLFLGVLEERLIVLEIGLWMCIVLAAYNSFVGVMGCVYFIRCGHITLHFVLAGIFACQAISLITVFCHDILIIFAYKKTLEEGESPSNASNRYVMWSKITNV